MGLDFFRLQNRHEYSDEYSDILVMASTSVNRCKIIYLSVRHFVRPCWDAYRQTPRARVNVIIYNL